MITSEIEMTRLIDYVKANEQADYCSQLAENAVALATLVGTSNDPRLAEAFESWLTAIETTPNDSVLQNQRADTLAHYLPGDWHPYVTALHVQDNLESIVRASLHHPGHYWEDDPIYPSEDWRYEVINGDTRVGYWEWVVNRQSEEME
jgi:hypothetical protein